VKRIVLCADDFGQDRAVDAGILRLLALGRLTAVSCLSEGPRWEQDAQALPAYAGSIDLGLHIDLTGTGAGARWALPFLVLRAFAGLLDHAAVTRRIEAQLDRFERSAARPPDFVDGHQHVHQLPGVRGALLEVLARRYPGSPPYVRCTVPRLAKGAKARIVALLGGRGLAGELARRGIPHNRDFGGIYSLDPRTRYGDLVKGWLDHVADGGLLLCHPAEPPGAAEDPIAAARIAELRYLASDDFPAACRASGVVLVRFGGTLDAGSR
jgi:chitin disaccharide deacetylase